MFAGVWDFMAGSMLSKFGVNRWRMNVCRSVGFYGRINAQFWRESLANECLPECGILLQEQCSVLV